MLGASQGVRLTRLHIGGQIAAPGWTVMNVSPGPAVDLVGDCVDLGAFADASVAEIYASHVYEHLAYQRQLPKALAEAHRVLVPGGVLRLSVPDLEVLARMLLSEELDFADRFMIMRMMFGGQMDEHDYHRVGLTWEILGHYLMAAGFARADRVSEHGLFDDASSLRFAGELISLNAVATKGD